MQAKQGVRTKTARRFSLAVSALASVAMSVIFAACGTVPVDQAASDAETIAQPASHIRFLADPNVGLTFAGTQSWSAGTLTIGLTAGDTLVLARSATNNNITINGNTSLGATVANTNIININYATGAPQNLILDYINGKFGGGNKLQTSWGTFINTAGNVNDTLSIRMSNPTPATNANVTFSEPYADLDGDSQPDLSFTKTGTGFIPRITVELGAGNDKFSGGGGVFIGGGGTSVATGTTPDTSSQARTALHVFGGAGNDNIICGKGNDILHGGPGNDAFDGGTGSGGQVSFYGDDGTDALSFAARTGNLTLALSGNPTSGEVNEGITIGTDIETLTGGHGDDTLSGSPTLGLKVTLSGGPGNDFFVQTGVGNDSNDTLVGGSGTDTVDYSGRTCNTNVTLEGTANDGCVGENDNVGIDIENVVTGSGADYVVGSALNNIINGGTGINFLNGGAGDDTFDQGTVALNTGTDTIVGGAGEDVIDYTLRGNSVSVNLNNTPTSGESGENDKVALDVEDGIGGGGSDFLIGNLDDNTLNGGAGTDTVSDCGGGSDLVLNCELLTGVAVNNCGITLP